VGSFFRAYSQLCRIERTMPPLCPQCTRLADISCGIVSCSCERIGICDDECARHHRLAGFGVLPPAPQTGDAQHASVPGVHALCKSLQIGSTTRLRPSRPATGTTRRGGTRFINDSASLGASNSGGASRGDGCGGAEIPAAALAEHLVRGENAVCGGEASEQAVRHRVAGGNVDHGTGVL